MTTPKRLAFVDALRGLAALYVAIFHMAWVPVFKPIMPEFMSPFVQNGWTGTTLFFIISAFTLSYSFRNQQIEKNINLFFYIRRIFRIVPLYYTWIIIVCFMAYGWNMISGIWPERKSFILYFFFGFNFFPGKQAGIVPASWTLGVEMIFYLIFPIIIRCCKNLQRSTIFFLISLLLSWMHYMLSHNIPNYICSRGILSHLPVFSIGIICYYVYEKLIGKSLSKNIPRFLIGGSLISMIAIPYLSGFFGKIPLFYPMSVVYGMLLIGLSIRPVRIIVNKGSVFVGLISYSVYLNHPKLIFYMSDIYKYIYSIGWNSSLCYAICVLATLIPLILISALTFAIIEKPGMVLGKRIIARLKVDDQRSYLSR